MLEPASNEVQTPARGIAIIPGGGQIVDQALVVQVLEGLPVGVWMLDASGRIWLANAAAKRLWGGTLWVGPEEYGQYHAWWGESGRVVQPGEWPAARALRSGHSVIGQRMVIQRFDGSLLTVLSSAVVLRDAAGQIAGLVVTTQDIDAEARTQASLRMAHDDLRTVLGALTSILIMLDKNGAVRLWNHAAEQAFGIRDADIRGKPFLRSPIPWDWNQIESALPGGSCDRPVHIDEIRCAPAGGRESVLAFTITPIRRAGGELDGILWHGADITARRLLEAQLRQAQKLESIGQLAAGIAHEINTPMQFIGDNHRFLADSFASLFTLVEHLRAAAAHAPEADRAAVAAAEAAADLPWLLAEVPKAIGQSNEGIQRVTSIVKAMKEFSHPGDVEIAPIDINHAIDNTLMVSRNAWKYVAEMVTDLDRALPPVAVLPGGFSQVVLNLVVNAAHAIEDRIGRNGGAMGTITIRTAQRGEQVEMTVADTGCGIPEAIRPRIFDPFFTTKEVGRGTGQGLTMVHTEIVERLGGEVSFTSEVGVGTTFAIRIPIRHAASTVDSQEGGRP